MEDSREVDLEGALVLVLDALWATRGRIDAGEVRSRFCAAVEKEKSRNESLVTRLEEVRSLAEQEGDEKVEEDILSDSQIASLEVADSNLSEVLKGLEELLQDARKLEEECWWNQGDYWKQLDARREELDSLELRTKLNAGTRELLEVTSVLNDAFCIWYDGAFGTIGGLRLGRLPDVPVEWSEINAAWGQVALLLATLAREVTFSFSKYRIVPMGSASKMAKVGHEKTTYDLFYSSNFPFFRSSFNNAMVAILSCVQELGEYAEKTDRTMSLPFSIQGDKVGGESIKTGGSDIRWTKALKSFLADLKWLVAWSTKRQKNANM